MTTSTHTMTADVPIRQGSGDGAETDYVKADVVFSFTPGTPGRRYSDDVEAIKCCPISEGVNDRLTFRELKDFAQDYLDGDGYDFACSIAKEQRGEK